jgi:hypothetical protein
MNNDDNHGRERDVQERIKSLMQAAGQIPKKQIAGEELQKLKTAASRLDQMLKSTADADLQALRSGAARLNQLLADIGTGKDPTSNLKRRRDWQKRGE